MASKSTTGNTTCEDYYGNRTRGFAGLSSYYYPTRPVVDINEPSVLHSRPGFLIPGFQQGFDSDSRFGRKKNPSEINLCCKKTDFDWSAKITCNIFDKGTLIDVLQSLDIDWSVKNDNIEKSGSTYLINH